MGNKEEDSTETSAIPLRNTKYSKKYFKNPHTLFIILLLNFGRDVTETFSQSRRVGVSAASLDDKRVQSLTHRYVCMYVPLIRWYLN